MAQTGVVQLVGGLHAQGELSALRELLLFTQGGEHDGRPGRLGHEGVSHGVPALGTDVPGVLLAQTDLLGVVPPGILLPGRGCLGDHHWTLHQIIIIIMWTLLA